MAAIVICIMCSCHTSRHATQEHRDSIRVETRYRVEMVPDTILVPVPAQKMQRETRDTCSVLRTDYAVSEAKVSGGTLFHSLENIVHNVPVPTEKKVERKDSIVYRETKVPVEVEKPLTRWQRMKIELGGWSFGAIGFWLFLYFLRLFKRRFF